MIFEFLAIVLVFAVLAVLGLPVFLAMGISGATGIVLVRGFERMADVPAFTYQGVSSFVLVAVPLFVLTGTLMHVTGASERLLGFVQRAAGRMPHALGLAVIGACAVFSAISGSSVATAATMGVVALPALAKKGYTPGQRGTLLAAGGTLGILIPPSIALIIYGVLTEQSVGRLFIAGILPGVALAVVFGIVLAITVRPAIRGEASPIADKARGLLVVLPTLGLPVLIIFLIYTGLATPTEVAGIAVLYVVVLGLIYRRLGLAAAVEAFRSALLSSAMIMMLIAFGSLLTRSLTLVRVPQEMAAWVSEANVSPFLTFSLMIGIYLLLGAVLEATSMIILTIPIFFPIATAIGIDPLVFGVIVVLAMEVAQITPPIGINLYVVSGVGNIPFERMIRPAIPYVVAMLVMIFAIYFMPDIALWLPGLMN